MGWVRRWVEEDAFLNFRVVEQIRAGHGPVFNVGERVEIFTSTLWLAMLTAARTVLPFVKIEYLSIAGGLCSPDSVCGGRNVAPPCCGAPTSRSRDRQPTLLVPFGAVVVVAVSASWDWATSGLENGLSLAWLGALMLVVATVTRPRATPVVDPRCAGGGRARGPGPAGAARSRGGDRGRGGRGAVVAAPSGCRARLARRRLPRAPGRLRGLPRRVLRRAGPEHRARQGLRRHVLVAGLELSRRPRRALLALGSPARDRATAVLIGAGERTASRVGRGCSHSRSAARSTRCSSSRAAATICTCAIAVAEPVRDRRAVRGASLAAAVPVAARGHRRLGVRRRSRSCAPASISRSCRSPTTTSSTGAR